MKSIYSTTLPYTIKSDINASKDYLNNITSENIELFSQEQLIVEELDIMTEEIEETHYSKDSLHLVTKEEQVLIDFCTEFHEILEQTDFNNFKPTKNISNEINVIGLNVDEAIYVVDKYLDDCYLTSLNTIRIVHGKGTGKLRQGIHTFLKKHPHVKSFRLGTFGEGEMGVTVIEFKK